SYGADPRRPKGHAIRNTSGKGNGIDIGSGQVRGIDLGNIAGSFIERLGERRVERGRGLPNRIHHGCHIGGEGLHAGISKIDRLAGTEAHEHPGSVAGRLEFKQAKPSLGPDLLDDSRRLGTESNLELILSYAVAVCAVAIK